MAVGKFAKPELNGGPIVEAALTVSVALPGPSSGGMADIEIKNGDTLVSRSQTPAVGPYSIVKPLVAPK